MPGRASNKERIARAAAEAAATKKAKAAKKKAAKKVAKKKAAKKVAKKKAARKTGTRKTATRKTVAKSAGRLKLVWVVCDQAGAPVKTFSHKEEAVARKEAKRLSENKGKPHFVKKEKVPLE